MEKLKIKVHSFCDVITNSSTTIYVSTHDRSIKTLEELIDYFLKKSGSTKKAKDLFDFRIELDESELEIQFDLCIEENPDENIEAAIAKLELKKNYKGASELRGSYIKGKINNNEWTPVQTNHREDHLVMIAKDDSTDTKDITDIVKRMFEIQESYD